MTTRAADKKPVYKGVTFRHDTQKYASRITINKKSVVLGCFDTPREAAIARDKYIISRCLNKRLQVLKSK